MTRLDNKDIGLICVALYPPMQEPIVKVPLPDTRDDLKIPRGIHPSIRRLGK